MQAQRCVETVFLLCTYDLSLPSTTSSSFALLHASLDRVVFAQLYGNEYTARITRDGTCVAADYGLVSGCRCPAVDCSSNNEPARVAPFAAVFRSVLHFRQTVHCYCMSADFCAALALAGTLSARDDIVHSR